MDFVFYLSKTVFISQTSKFLQIKVYQNNLTKKSIEINCQFSNNLLILRET